MGDQLYPAQLLEYRTRPDTVRPLDAASSTHRKARRSETRRHCAEPPPCRVIEVTSVVRDGKRRGNEGGIKTASQMTASFVGDTL